MKSAGRQVLAAFKGRGYSAQAATKAAETTAAGPLPEVSRLPNGIVVATLENNSPVSRVAALFNAGARYETPDNEGITHCLRNACSLSSEKASAFGITKHIGQVGGSLSCTTTREHLIYSVECLRNRSDVCLEYMGHLVSGPAFKQWELDGAKANLSLDLAVLDTQPHVQLAEALHKAAYRNTLGNSLYMPAHKIGSHSPDALRAFVGQHLTSGNMALVGVGVDHGTLVKAARLFSLPEGPGTAAEKAMYYGGEMRVNNNNPVVHAAIVAEGLGLTSPDVMAMAVLQNLVGSGPYVKYGSNTATSKVGHAAAQGASGPHVASCMSSSYTDTGLFGFQVVGQAQDMSMILKSVCEAFAGMTKETVTDVDLQRAKTQLKAAMYMEYEKASTFAEDLGLQALVLGSFMSTAEVEAAVDKVSAEEVQNIAKKIINGKASMAAVGDLSNTPYLDQLL